MQRWPGRRTADGSIAASTYADHFYRPAASGERAPNDASTGEVTGA